MRPSVRPALVLTAAVALTVPLAIAGPAQAGAYRPVSERTLENSSMGAADVPRWMWHGGRPEVERFFSKGRDAGGPELCPSETDPINGKQARELMYSRATLWEVPPSRLGQLGSYIYQYRSRGDAQRAWADLTAKASTCPSFVQEESSDSGRARLEVDTRVTTLPNLFGTAGLEIWTDVRTSFNSDDPAQDMTSTGNTYAHFYLAGTSIVKVQHLTFNGDARTVGRVTRGFVQSMAIVVAQRVEQRSSR